MRSATRVDLIRHANFRANSRHRRVAVSLHGWISRASIRRPDGALRSRPTPRRRRYRAPRTQTLCLGQRAPLVIRPKMSESKRPTAGVAPSSSDPLRPLKGAFTCMQCGIESPPQSANTPLLSTHHGWRFSRRVGPGDSIVFEWRCPKCWAAHRSASSRPKLASE